ncbi:MAG: DUF5615 family PIN-like protein [Nostoc sp. ChiQUE02]|uniref:DUF5615 family PIN-like protein n=1 Tax=Nostoc sp. ChiQUE02 TaxID=3075377 RepID=UPI002AD2621A|nr:DUF5615 family PIN-like protein [Nostoc sp. ChiQUE02]MDZ8232263.1 DUF5615 family PIN-like protein [Nostoc sp. ChiQUE02]
MNVVSIQLGYAIASWQDLPIKSRVEMLRLLADENFNNQIVRGILRRKSEIDIVRVQDVGLSKTDDRVILEWAAQQGRVLLTHDVETITRYAYERVQAGLEMPGVFEISRSISVGLAIEDILLITKGSFEGEWEGQVQYLPLC